MICQIVKADEHGQGAQWEHMFYLYKTCVHICPAAGKGDAGGGGPQVTQDALFFGAAYFFPVTVYPLPGLCPQGNWVGLSACTGRRARALSRLKKCIS